MEPEHDADDEVAALLGVDVQELHKVIGAGWSPHPHHEGGIFEVGPLEPWYLLGSPYQLMAGRSAGRPSLAVPRGDWEGVATLRYTPEHVTSIDLTDPDGVRRVRAELLRRRRSSFRYCDRCLELTPPEHRMDDVCMGCATSAYGVVF